MPAAPDIETRLRAEPIRATLQPKLLGRTGLTGAQNTRAVYLSSGRAVLSGSGDATTLRAPALLWAPWTADRRLTIAAGSTGYHLSTGPSTLTSALRHNPNATDLGYLIDRQYRVALEDEQQRATVQACFAGLVQEMQDEGPMHHHMVEAHLSVLLITLYRLLRASDMDLSTSVRVAPLANRFITLVEAHLHERWSVTQFCNALGVSRDQLHAACLKSYQRTPGLLIRQRAILEARRLLEQSTLTIDQIGARLGFAGGPQFNRYFKTMEGIPPGRFRKDIRQQAHHPDRPSSDLAAWP